MLDTTALRTRLSSAAAVGTVQSSKRIANVVSGPSLGARAGVGVRDGRVCDARVLTAACARALSPLCPPAAAPRSPIDTVVRWSERAHDASWAWNRVNSLEAQLAAHPTFVVGEALFLAMSLLAFWHAFVSTAAGSSGQRRLRLVWIATFVAGTANDYIFMLMPMVRRSRCCGRPRLQACARSSAC